MKSEIPSLSFVATQAALQAGELLRKGFGSKTTIKLKDGIQNLVTEYDNRSEECIVKTIHEHFPGHSILAEESGATKKPRSTILWVIDPLDGTVNFAHQIPLFSVSIAACQGEEILCGVVYQPMTQELFLAEKGKGAYLNGKPLQVFPSSTLENSLLSTGFPYNVHENPLHCIDLFANIASRGYPIRRLGSAAIDLCYVAAGRFAAFWEVGLKPWDVAAGKLMLEEAGGRFSDWEGKPRPLMSDGPVLASNGHIHEKMLSFLRGGL